MSCASFGSRGGVSEDEVLTSVQQLPDGVEVAGVHGGLDENVDDDRAQVWKVKSGVSPPVLRLLRGIVQLARGDDLVGAGDGGAVCGQHLYDRLVGQDTPVAVLAVWPEVERLTGHHDLEPVALVREGEVPYEAEAGPARRGHWPPQLFVGESLELREHMATLASQAVEQHAAFGRFVNGHATRLGLARMPSAAEPKTPSRLPNGPFRGS